MLFDSENRDAPNKSQAPLFYTTQSTKTEFILFFVFLQMNSAVFVEVQETDCLLPTKKVQLNIVQYSIGFHVTFKPRFTTT